MLFKHTTNVYPPPVQCLRACHPFFSFRTRLPRRANAPQVAVRPHQTTTGFPALLPGEGDEGVLWGRLLVLWAPLGISRLASQIHMDYWRDCYATTPWVHFSGWFAHPDEQQCYPACTGTDYPPPLQPGEQCGTA